jgi:hypothetical protein
VRDLQLQDARDLPRVRSDLERDPIIGRQAMSEQLDLIRFGLDPPSRAHFAVLADRDLAEIQVHVQPHISHPHRLLIDQHGGEPVGKRHRRIRARSAPGQVAGAANEKAGLEAHRAKAACPTCVLPKAPVPVTRP